MGPTVNPRLHASARRYLARRLERTLMGGESRGGPDAVRLPSFWFGCGAVLAAAGLIISLVVPVLRPGTKLGDHRIVLNTGTSGLFVRVEQTWHPVFNLTSAWLIVGHADEPTRVAPSAFENVELGASLGIPGAPTSFGEPLPESEAAWTVCDGTQTSIVVGPPGEAELLPAEAATLVRGPSGAHYLLFDGRRTQVDPTDPAVRRALRLDDVVPTAVSAMLLNTTPEVAALRPPSISGLGNPGPAQLPGSAVGDVVVVHSSSGDEHFVVLSAGVQRVGRLTADLIRFGGQSSAAEIPSLRPDALVAVPSVGTLAVADYPDRITVAQNRETVCLTWTAAGIGFTTPPPAAHRMLSLAQADGTGPALDAVSIPAGRSVYVGPQHGAGGFLVADTGVRFAVEDDDSARILGLEHAVVAPVPPLMALPTGPALSQRSALTLYDGVPAAPSSGTG